MSERDREAVLNARLDQIHKRVQWMADEEARSAWVNGVAAQGGFWPKKLKLLDETDRILDELEGRTPNA
jgi:hypothetical protein